MFMAKFNCEENSLLNWIKLNVELTSPPYINVIAAHLLPGVKIRQTLFWMETTEQKGSHGN